MDGVGLARNMTLTKEERLIIEETRESQIKLNTVLLGANGDDGLVGEVKDLSKSHGMLKRNFWMLIAFLIGSGVITGGLLAVLS